LAHPAALLNAGAGLPTVGTTIPHHGRIGHSGSERLLFFNNLQAWLVAVQLEQKLHRKKLLHSSAYTGCAIEKLQIRG
jgi:hypothetical protein